MAENDDRIRVHSYIRQRVLSGDIAEPDTSGVVEGPAPSCAASARGCGENSIGASGVYSSGSPAGPGTGAKEMMYTDDLRARLEHLCAEHGIPMPALVQHTGPDPIVKQSLIHCPPLHATCPADHRVRAWELARIWWGVAMLGRPFYQQQAMAAVNIILE